jgi:hypothetical protein
VVLRVLALCYLSAFASHYGQIAGLWGRDGILPAEVRARQTFLKTQAKSLLQTPTILLYSNEIADFLRPLVGSVGDVDTSLYFLCLMGSFVALAAFLTEICCNSLTFLLLWCSYLSVFTIGQDFLSFQWDILLLEVGLIAVIYARLPLLQTANDLSTANILGRELIRWLSFRLLFGSGVVKLQAGCPTWWNLSALYYHFETQCLPTPLSWYFHQLPPYFLHFGVAYTYFAMIYCSCLFYSPLRSLRLLGVVVNIAMQGLILVSGNYNFFNILTIGLVLSVCDDEDFRRYRGLRWLRIGLGVKDYYGEKKEKKEGKSRWEMMLIRGKTALSIAICMGFIGYIWTLYLPLGQILAGKLPFTASNLRDTVRFT